MKGPVASSTGVDLRPHLLLPLQSVVGGNKAQGGTGVARAPQALHRAAEL